MSVAAASSISDHPYSVFEGAFLKIAKNCKVGSLSVTTSNGEIVHIKGDQLGLEADMHIHNPLLGKAVLFKGANGFAESYLAGHWSTRDLVKLLCYFLQNMVYLRGQLQGKPLWRLFIRALEAWRANTKTQAKKNIHHHYDLGNAFYSIWLDKGMHYSAAVFKSETDTLEQAQQHKNEQLLAALPTLSIHDHILEIGCGWGGFAAHFCDKHRAKYTGVTISKAQAGYARERLKHLDNAEILEQDYRDIEGRYDHIISVEMIEAVGEKYWPIYFKTLKKLLKPKGKIVIQSIVIKPEFLDYYRKNPDFIREHIFPGGFLPSIPALEQVAKEHFLNLEHTIHFGMDYARTLKEWQYRFSRDWPAAEALGFDEKFKRLWHYYLAYCQAGFINGHIDVVQMTFGHMAA
jgi:cyclopropane-fatty-acyl-phospholipid synthase